jgi:hypothetical protein
MKSLADDGEVVARWAKTRLFEPISTPYIPARFALKTLLEPLFIQALQHHLALPRSATSILDAFRRLFEHLYDPCAPQYARNRQRSAGHSA